MMLMLMLMLVMMLVLVPVLPLRASICLSRGINVGLASACMI